MQTHTSAPLRDARIEDPAMRAFLTTLADVEPSAPTWCPGWSAHELTAHVAAAAAERARKVDDHVAGRPPTATRSWEEREPPYREMPDAALRAVLVDDVSRFEASVARLDDDAVVTYTGWDMSRGRLLAHSHSEAVLHRWDLVGSDATSRELLSDEALVHHALAVFAAIPALAEARQWMVGDSSARPVMLRTPGRDDVVIRPGRAPTTGTGVDGLAIDLESHEVPLLLWGRCPPRLRDPHASDETARDVLRRLAYG